jgi:hypothetical protein
MTAGPGTGLRSWVGRNQAPGEADGEAGLDGAGETIGDDSGLAEGVGGDEVPGEAPGNEEAPDEAVGDADAPGEAVGDTDGDGLAGTSASMSGPRVLIEVTSF